ncbi:MAG: hypothetical protein ACM3U2_11680, partial [Deltaproteobacteria bacterium]
ARPHDNGRALLRLAQGRMAERYEREADRVQPLLARWRRGELDDERAVEELLRLLITTVGRASSARP